MVCLMEFDRKVKTQAAQLGEPSAHYVSKTLF